MAFDYAAKIQALLQTAEGYDRSAEKFAAEGDIEHEREHRAGAANYRAMAEGLMIKYRISEEEALATEGAEGATPIVRQVRVTTRNTGPLRSYYTATFVVIARHCGVRTHLEWNEGYVAHVVGYEGDVRYAEFLWTAALLMFSTRINPRWDGALSVDENVWRMRNAGIKRRAIADAAGWDGSQASARSRVQRTYLRECARRNEPVRAAGLGHQADTFQEAYASEFQYTLSHRLREARDAADSIAGGIVLHGRSERVDEAFYTRFPQYRPRPAADTPPPAPCPRCAKAKRGACREHSYLLVTAADRRRWDRSENSPSARAGRDAGRAAAEGVVVTRGHTRATRVDGTGHGAIDDGLPDDL